MLQAAWGVHAHAYVPYSSFPVGAALRTPDGRIFAGANVENASYGLGRCAEQSAVQAMASAGGRTLTHLVVVSDADLPASPCGACRQVLYEFGPDAEVWLANGDGAIRRTTVRTLLPDAFTLRP
ncbi:MAG: cytidine deaminase [Trueperaceae bacterium]